MTSVIAVIVTRIGMKEGNQRVGMCFVARQTTKSSVETIFYEIE